MWALGDETVGHAAIRFRQALILAPTPADAYPAITIGDRVELEILCIGGGNVVTLLGEDARQCQAATRLDQARQLRRQGHQRTGEDIGHQHIRLHLGQLLRQVQWEFAFSNVVASGVIAEASRACTSISVPTASLAPSNRAAIARIPEPQPKSSTLQSFRSWPSSHSRHSAVVGCVPVPNARPGSSSRFTASGSGAACQLGTIHRRWPKRIGWKLSIQLRSQSWSSMISLWCSGSGPPVSSSIWARTAAASVPSSNRASKWVWDHSGVVLSSGSKIGWSSASMKVTETAPTSRKASS